MRDQPTTQSRIVGMVPPTGSVLYLDRSADGRWFLVRYGNAKGWVSARYLREAAASVAQQSDSPQKQWYVLNGGQNSCEDAAATAREAGLPAVSSPGGFLEGAKRVGLSPEIKVFRDQDGEVRSAMITMDKKSVAYFDSMTACQAMRVEIEKKTGSLVDPSELR